MRQEFPGRQKISSADSHNRRIRLDRLLVQRGLAESREKAKAIIMAGLVEVDGNKADKPGRLVGAASKVRVKEKYPPYVSRGGLKLEAALEHFSVEVQGRVLLDVGASTGGFTDCLLQCGAKKVIAVDVGYGQLDWRLRQDPRVQVMERTNIRHLRPKDLGAPLDGAVIDVSFISLRLVIPVVTELLSPDAFIVALIKPQFELNKRLVGKGGVVRDPDLHRKVVDELQGFFQDLNWHVKGLLPSPLLGPKGNREFLIYLVK